MELQVAKTGDYLAPRTCLPPPWPDHDTATELLSQAADAIAVGNLDQARELVQRDDMPSLFGPYPSRSAAATRSSFSVA